ncbi:MAG: rhodanese-like domain-containing protein [Burkholderiaceae bacterium]
MIATIDARELHAALRDGAEIALIDVREQGAHSEAHPLLSACLGLSRLDLQAARFLPRRDLRIVVHDGGEDDDALARRGVGVLRALGYTDVRLLKGGAAAWQAAGLELFSGVNVPSKAFGEVIEHRHDTPRVTADELAAMRAGTAPIVILDSRPMDEYRRISIPGGIDCPGAELVYRVHEMAPDPATTVVVNCAGRTRSIIGAQSLINAGVPNRVVALKDGTMGWQLAGHEPATGRTEHARAPGAEALAVARARATAVARRFQIESIDGAGLAAWLADSSRTTIVLDVRTAQEYAAGHWPGAWHAPGGQLVQATDEYVMVRGARLVLADGPDGVRATMTAHWLRQMGWPQVRVLTEQAAQPEVGPEPASPWPEGVECIAATDLLAAVAGEDPPTLIDLDSSRQFARGHLPGAWWSTRARLPQAASELAARGARLDPVVFVSRDDTLAAWACRDWIGAGHGAARVLTGGAVAWQQAGGGIISGEADRMLGAADDVWLKPYERVGEGHRAMQEYLTWEVGLVAQLEREGTLQFWWPAEDAA